MMMKIIEKIFGPMRDKWINKMDDPFNITQEQREQKQFEMKGKDFAKKRKRYKLINAILFIIWILAVYLLFAFEDSMDVENDIHLYMETTFFMIAFFAPFFMIWLWRKISVIKKMSNNYNIVVGEDRLQLMHNNQITEIRYENIIKMELRTIKKKTLFIDRFDNFRETNKLWAIVTNKGEIIIDEKWFTNIDFHLLLQKLQAGNINVNTSNVKIDKPLGGILFHGIVIGILLLVSIVGAIQAIFYEEGSPDALLLILGIPLFGVALYMYIKGDRD